MKLRKKLISLPTLFSLVLICHAKEPTRLSQLSRITKEVKDERVETLLRRFVRSGHPTRIVGSKSHLKARAYLTKELKALRSGTFKEHRFTADIDWAIADYQSDFKKEIVGKFEPSHRAYKMWDGFTKGMVAFAKTLKGVEGVNLIWEKKGSQFPNEVLIVGCNYDSMVHNKNTLLVEPKAEAPGADNNGSGVAVALSLIELLSTRDIPRTVRVVFFDYEQFRNLGARAYVKEQLNKKEEVAAYLGLVMLGHDSKSSDRTGKHGNMKLYGRKKSGVDKTFAQGLIKAGKKSSHGVRFEYSANSFQSAGHINFWESGMAVLSFTQDWDNDFNVERNQTSNDFVETLNLKTLYRSYRFISGGVLAWVYDIKK